MFLKTLTLRGFKSFADPTTIELEPGVTVVVGPNGSGKSNVVDAVAWVLGAQGPRTVRSSKMDDVIFAGTAQRQPLGRAEVSLTIDNTARRLPIDFTEVTVTRTLFRSGESEYALNGTPCRLLDVQELFSDSGVGRQQHVIIGQGQLDAILSARPEDRRAVIEEAAGVLKYRRRRERAERRLEATEASLVRLQDLLREVRRTLKPLQRQAEAAARHRELAAELRTLRLHLAGRELFELARRADALEHAVARLVADEGRLRAELQRLDETILAGERHAAAAREADVSPLLARIEAVRERARGTAGVVAERRRSVAAALEAVADDRAVADLQAEAATVAEELADAERRAVALLPEWDVLAIETERLEAEQRALEARFPQAAGDGPQAQGPQGQGPQGQPATPAASAPRARRELARANDEAGRRRESLARALERVGSLEQRAGEVADATERSALELAALSELSAQAGPAHEAAVADRDEAAIADADAADRLREAERVHHSATARAEALSLALDQARARAGLERLSGARGVLGTLLDAVRIDAGYELAFEAAAEAVLEAVLVEDIAAGRHALAELRGLKGGGTVLVAGLGRPAGSGHGADDLATGAAGAGVEPLRARVHATVDAAESVLDLVVRDVVCCEAGFEQACDLALARPGLTVVTREGDRFAPGGWRVGAGRVGATKAALEEVLVAAGAGAREVAKAASAAEAARAAADTARVHVEETGRRLEQLRSDQRRLESATGELAARREALGRDLAAARASVVALEEEAAGDARRLTALSEELAVLEREEAEALERHAEERAARRSVEERARALASLHADLEVKAAGLEERRGLLSDRAGEVAVRLERHEAERRVAARRSERLRRTAVALERLEHRVDDRLRHLDAARRRAADERDRQGSSEALVSARIGTARRDRAAAEQAIAVLRERIQRAELEQTEVRLRRETAEESLRHDLEVEPADVQDAPCGPLPPGLTARDRLLEVERELRVLGPVNALAQEELATLTEREEFLGRQLEDVRSARRELGSVVRAVDEEIGSLFESAYEDVAGHFETLFARLFPGGTGRLVRTEGPSPLDCGVEIEARPPGRNVRRLSLLSGGERSLVALAFLFAVFRSRPSPFYLMDEVEAALDDVNLHRFLNLVAEFRDEAQLILVSHQKRTMEAADVLYGVTMQPGGASKVVSERVVPRVEPSR